jgi:hypothetical protein
MSLQTSQQPQQAVCSVLTTIVDHILTDPSPLEPREFQQKNVKVPVLRIFGPILRRDNGATNGARPEQSACLYIHGAFPYLLARPVVAGPDGSLHWSTHKKSESSNSQQYLDWDDPLALSRVAPLFKDTLEEMLRATLSGTSQQRPLLRQITIVMGRGFYTYCPGPAAPFLRVEYYDPSDRWRIKLALERGLDLPFAYHPNAVQYDAVGKPRDASEPADGLKFHCYEAHIPYTMQFFKDWNLAGMQYVHLSDALFRRKLPYHARRPISSLPALTDTAQLFLQSNTPEKYMWGAGDEDIAKEGIVLEASKCENQELFSDLLQPLLSESSAASQISLQQSTHPDQQSQPSSNDALAAQNIAGPWSKRETSCDVELDACVEHMRNIDTVITELHDEEKHKVHWRAVPSLKEIWKQERHRMSKLLSPENDFLSHDDDEACKQPAFTLDVKTGAALPGSRLAREGMERLVRCTDGLYDSYTRVLKDIVDRHRSGIVNVDSELVRLDREKLLGPQSPFEQMQSTPADCDVLQALDHLVSDFDGREGTIPFSHDSAIDQVYEKRSSSQYSSSPIEEDVSIQLSQDNRFQHLTQYLDSSRSEAVRGTSFVEELAATQRIERGEMLVDGQLGFADEFIDPVTLLAYDDDEDEHDYLNDDGDFEFKREGQAILHQLEVGRDDVEKVDAMQAGLSEREAENVDSDGAESREFSLPSQDSFCTGRRQAGGDEEAPFKTVVPPWLHLSNACVERQIRAPLRMEMRGIHAASLLLIQKSRDQPHWMEFSANYQNMYMRKRSLLDWFPIISSGVNVHRARPPPSYAAVTTWVKRQKRRSISSSFGRPAKCAKVNKAMSGNGEQVAIDLNARPLIVGPDDVDPMKLHQPQQVEEFKVEDGHSGQMQMSLSQSSAHGDLTKSQSNVCEDSEGNAGRSYENSTQDSLKRNRDKPSQEALQGIGNQGGRIWVEGGGRLKAKTNQTQTESTVHDALPTPVSIMSIEVFTKCRQGFAAIGSSQKIAMTPDSGRDQILAVVFTYAVDPGGGASLEILERGCLLVPPEAELKNEREGQDKSIVMKRLSMAISSATPKDIMGHGAPFVVECLNDEKQLLRRFAHIVQWKDPDMLCSWDTQGAGLGYLIERGSSLDENGTMSEIDMARLFGRTPSVKPVAAASDIGNLFNDDDATALPKGKGQWKGSGHGAEWDERVGAGVVAASIVRISIAAIKN